MHHDRDNPEITFPVTTARKDWVIPAVVQLQASAAELGPGGSDDGVDLS
jgi:hypothetical protein